ncbi:DUF4112 domain-containing protein [Capnocytophaga cynodegmi]|uniref:DUF4112 domain-containing protein n=1 Tax=Capnocytophaga cynodegmi TaxID=28189 RepID=UPI00385BC894
MQRSTRRTEQHQAVVSNELQDINKALQQEENRRRIKEEKRRRIEQSDSYQSIKNIKKWMDDYFLDGIIGLIPVIGDTFTQLFNITFIYVALFKVGSIPLTLAVIYNSLKDMLIGMIPYVGIVLDFFYKSYRKNFELIVGFVEDDRQIIREVNKKAFSIFIGIVIIIVLIYYLVKFIMDTLSAIWEWISALVS